MIIIIVIIIIVIIVMMMMMMMSIIIIIRTHGLGYLRVDTSSHQFLQAGDAFLRSRFIIIVIVVIVVVIIFVIVIIVTQPSSIQRLSSPIFPCSSSVRPSVFHAS